MTRAHNAAAYKPVHGGYPTVGKTSPRPAPTNAQQCPKSGHGGANGARVVPTPPAVLSAAYKPAHGGYPG